MKRRFLVHSSTIHTMDRQDGVLVSLIPDTLRMLGLWDEGPYMQSHPAVLLVSNSVAPPDASSILVRMYEVDRNYCRMQVPSGLQSLICRHGMKALGLGFRDRGRFWVNVQKLT